MSRSAFSANPDPGQMARDPEALFTAGRPAGFSTFDRRVTRRLQESEFEHVDRHKALALCRRLYLIVLKERGPGFAEAVADAAGGAAREGLAPRAAFRVAGLALSLLGLDLPVGVGRSLKQLIFDGA
ncbi:hypothetical protein FJY71_00725 [candidate division WOR-3 bacterium]|nr:hypothetical protein [candidate division WOR-3 bacterium]